MGRIPELLHVVYLGQVYRYKGNVVWGGKFMPAGYGISTHDVGYLVSRYHEQTGSTCTWGQPWRKRVGTSGSTLPKAS